MDIDKMSFDEINKLLNSGIYIPNKYKDILQKKINENKDVHLEDFPSLIKETKYLRSIDFSKLIEKHNDYNIISVPLVVNNEIVIPFDEIKKIYDEFAIYRIKMQYMILNNKIFTLECINFLNKDRGKEFFKYFNYESLLKKETIMKTCLEIYFSMHHIIQYINIIIDKFRQLRYKKDNNQVIKQEDCNFNTDIEKLLESDIFINLFVGTYSKYVNELDGIITFIKNKIIKIKNYSITEINIAEFDNIILECQTQLLTVESFINKIIFDNDPHIRCEYDIVLGEFENNQKIKKLGIFTYTYLSCETNLDLSLDNNTYDDNLLIHITPEELDDLFNYRNKNNSDCYFKIYTKQLGQSKNVFHYKIDEDIEIGNAKLVISNLPKDYLFHSSIDIDNDSKMIFPNRFIKWLNKSELMDIKFVNDFEDDTDFDDDSQQENNYMIKNALIVDRLFNSLLEQDPDSRIIKPNMLDSFRHLAYKTSIKTRFKMI